ncbi:hypothetical protein AA0119_g9366 [Alternaria tenuissima]|uniref:Uncharacterized protein n=1 Tax=Alternaria tenuissima TaxID=119927 RepID=A0A4V1WLB5_9PLEO|nr:hypothetical protein B0T12DRAFT_363049 [Alternaria alternata]RYN21428.1 hypothetical protein AA0115_g9764 [Alternaria tenuissima]OWY57176.1 galactosyl transferase [Alternaria alternata]RYN38941.1 hypothetical protein AA0114_g11404 [Alternaria tenuissima]RYN80644.1 hypothetical protein AA0120_g10454 [Alternaria tenuissima]
MLPPIDPTVLQRNPNFEILYKDLCTRKLNHNGSTRDTKKQRVHDEIRKTLTSALTTLHTTQILTTSLSTLPSKGIDLPLDLHAVIEIVTAQLNGQISASDRDILSSDIGFFHSNIGLIASALSTQLVTIADYLCMIASPSSVPPISSLANIAQTLENSATESLPSDLQAATTHLTNTLTTLLNTHSTLLSTSIKILEQTQQGALARHTKSSAELLQTKAILLGLQAKIHTLLHPPPPEFVDALKEYRKGLGGGKRALWDREALARRELELYGKAGEKGMRDLAKRKKGLAEEAERIEAEISKLQRGE